MSKVNIFGYLVLTLIIGVVLYDLVSFNLDIGKLSSETLVESGESYLSPHAKMKPSLVDYGLVAEAPEPEVLGRAVSFTLEQPAAICKDNSAIVTLAWNKYQSARGYVVQRRQVSKKWLGISVLLSSQASSFEDMRLSGPGTYTYRIRALVGKRAIYSTEHQVSVPDCSSKAEPLTESLDSIQVPIQSTETTTEMQSTSQDLEAVYTLDQAESTPGLVEESASPVLPGKTLTWGAFNGWRVEDGPAFETAVGKKLMNRAVFVHWGNESDFPSYLGSSLAPNNATLTIFWEAMDYNGHLTDQPRFSYDAILRGDWDTYITNFAESARKYGQPVILIPFEEMNGNWNPWAGTKNGNSAEKHKAAFRYIHKFFASVTNVKFGWAVNQVSVPDVRGNQLEDYYPGGEYVDYVGVDGFNFGSPWLSFAEVFDSSLKRLNVYGKPIYIFSMASAEGVNKAEWIRDALTIQIPKYERLVGWVWFNEKKERDWRVWSDANSLSAFKAALP